MNLNFPHVYGARKWAALGGAVTLGVIGLYALRTPAHTPTRSRFRPASHEMIKVSAAKYRTPDVEAPPLLIEADTTQHGIADPHALQAVREAILAIDLQMPPTLSVPTEALPSESAWMLWGRLRTTPAAVTMPAEAGVAAYAVRSAQGMTLCLVNRSSEKKLLRLHIRLPRGVYSSERLTFTPLHPVVQADSAHPNLPTESRLRTISDDGQAADAVQPLPPVQLERLQGRTLSTTTTVRKPCLLLPGQVCLFRYTDVAQAARAALNETYDSLHAMAFSSPNPARRLRHILEEGDRERSSLSPGGKNSGARLSGIHRLLLLTAQVQSMQRNYQQRHVVDAEHGAAVVGALERLTDALAETSAGLLELVPQIVVREETDVSSAQAPAGAETSLPAHRLTVTVSLANWGHQSPGMVKLGLDTAALPRGVACEPDDPAYFGSVHPGQSVRAVFHVRCPAGTLLRADRCGGDVSYFVAGTPAHLRIRAW